jgi:hypothetical protein
VFHGKPMSWSWVAIESPEIGDSIGNVGSSHGCEILQGTHSIESAIWLSWLLSEGVGFSYLGLRPSLPSGPAFEPGGEQDLSSTLGKQ